MDRKKVLEALEKEKYKQPDILREQREQTERILGPLIAQPQTSAQENPNVKKEQIPRNP